MKTLITLLLFAIPILSNSQMLPDSEIQELRRLMQTEISKIEDGGPQGEAKKQQITQKYYELEQKAISDFNYKQNTKNQNERNIDAQNSIKEENSRVQKQIYNQDVLTQLKQNQIQSQNNYNQEISNSLNNLSRSMQALQFQNIKTELDRRSNVANNFVGYHSDRITKLTNLYNQISKVNFSKNLNGLYSAHLFSSKKYSFVNNQELVTETNCLVKVENNIIKNVYLYGKEEFELNYPKEYPEVSNISNGIVKYSDYQNLETVTILILEPFMSRNPKEHSLIKAEVGYLTIWTDNKKEEGKILYIQELNDKGNIVREISTPLTYAKNEKLIVQDKTTRIPVNSGNALLFFGEITQTPYGQFPLYPKMSKNDMKPLKDGEERTVEIKKYRE